MKLAPSHSAFIFIYTLVGLVQAYSARQVHSLQPGQCPLLLDRQLDLSVWNVSPAYTSPDVLYIQDEKDVDRVARSDEKSARAKESGGAVPARQQKPPVEADNSNSTVVAGAASVTTLQKEEERPSLRTEPSSAQAIETQIVSQAPGNITKEASEAAQAALPPTQRDGLPEVPISAAVTHAEKPDATAPSASVESDEREAEEVAEEEESEEEQEGPSAGIPEFPSFLEWKQRHLQQAAAAQAEQQHHKSGSNAGHKAKTETGLPANGHGDSNRIRTGAPESKRDDMLRKDAINVSTISEGRPDGVMENDHEKTNRHDQRIAHDHRTSETQQQRHRREQHAFAANESLFETGYGESEQHFDDPLEPPGLTPDLAVSRILHPVPHTGSNDPYLDPLISLRDRTNYASVDCSATLLRSSKSTRSASSILSSKKDRYMLTPCNAKDEKFVIVELCDEIQIDSLVLANLEFFSSMFKTFRVRVGTAYPETVGRWTELGTWRAGNVRGLQVFRPPQPDTGGFYRYLRIDFISHYGTEYYCPVSILRIYGLTQLDAYRRDQEREARLNQAVEQGEELDEKFLLGQEQLPYLGALDHAAHVDSEAEQEVVLELVQLREDEQRMLFAEAGETVSPILSTASLEGGSATISSSSTSTSWSAAIAPEVEATTSPARAEEAASHKPSFIMSEKQTSQPASAAVPTGLQDRQPTASVPALDKHVSQGSTQGSSSLTSAKATQTNKTDKAANPTATSSDSPQPAAAEHTSVQLQSHAASGSEAKKTEQMSTPTAQQKTAAPFQPSIPAMTKVATSSSSKSTSSTPTSRTSTKTSTKSAAKRSSKPSSSKVSSSSASLSAASHSASSSSSPVYRTAATPVPTAKRNDTRSGQQQQPQVVYTHSSHGSNPQPNESIYGTIMKRLMALEVNATLSTGYVEEHSRLAWETFRRLEERLGGFEKARLKQDQLLRRLMLDLDLHRARMEAERMELSSQLSILSKEVLLGKRLTLVQLFALVILLFFVILTRGSPSTPLLQLAPSLQPAFTTHPAFSGHNPRPSKSQHARPRSVHLYGREGLEALDRRDRRAFYRDKDGLDRARTPASAAPNTALGRTGSLKRPVRLSGASGGKRPLALPTPVVRSHTDTPPSRSSSDLNVLASPAAILSPASSGASARLPSPGEVGPSLASVELAGATESRGDPFLLQTPPQHVPLARSHSPNGSATPKSAQPPSTGALDSIKRKLKQLRRSSLPEASLLTTTAPTPQVAPIAADAHSSSRSTSSPAAASASGTPRRFFLASTSGGNSPAGSRLRSQTVESSMSAADGDDEGNHSSSKAWLSTSEDSAGEDEDGLPPAVAQIKDTSWERNGGSESKRNSGLFTWPSISSAAAKSKATSNYPPSPDPSDAERP